jgi:hypothetical protein
LEEKHSTKGRTGQGHKRSLLMSQAGVLFWKHQFHALKHEMQTDGLSAFW